VRDWPRAPLAARRCSRKRSAVVGAASRDFAETAGLGLGRLARKCCATCFRTKPTIAGRCVCSCISSDSRCRPRWRPGSGIGKSCGKSAGSPVALATIPKNWSSEGIARAQAARVSRVDGWAAMVETSRPSRWACCRSSGRRQRSEAGAWIPRVGGRCRKRGPSHQHAEPRCMSTAVPMALIRQCATTKFRCLAGKLTKACCTVVERRFSAA